MAISACGGDDDDNNNNNNNNNGTDFAKAALVTSNPTGRSMDSLIRAGAKLDAKMATLGNVDLFASIQSLTVDQTSGDGFLSFDAPGMSGGIAVYTDLVAISQDQALGGAARVIVGANTQLTQPKGLIVVPSLNLIIVADNGAKNIKTYPINATGDVAPMHTIALGDMRGVWDVHYDVTADILWAAGTDGVALAYDTFSSTFGASGPSRTITPTGLGNVKVSVNLHGIAYDSTLDVLMLSDVGDAASATDGQLFVITGARTANGETQVTAMVGGAATGLGNPVDLIYQDGDLFVAEKSNNTILRFDGAAALIGALATVPAATVTVDKVESVTVSAVGGIGGGALLTTSNPDGIDSDTIVQIPLTLNAVAATFNTVGVVTSIESVALASSGDGYISFASGANGGILVIDDLAGTEADGDMRGGDRLIRGAATTLVAPKGLQVTGDLVVVADFGAKAITVFPANAVDNAEPTFRTTDLGGMRSVWDVHHDAAKDRLFAAGTDGVLLVYDQFSTTRGADGPSRTITPAGSVNLHGVAYDAESDTIFVTDVGDAMVATDGQIFVIENASTATGMVTPKVTISGAASKLGNPVDCAYDGERLYVAEKSNDLLLRFDALATLSGGSDRAADASIAVTKAESVTLVP